MDSKIRLTKENLMKSLRSFLLVIVMVFVSGCSHYPDITGKVVDSGTGKPIEGAIVVAQWTKPRGWLGEQQSDLHKITETLTDKEGKFSLTGNSGLPINPPMMIIYKEGYIPLRNDAIFPSCNLVKENEWKNNVTYKLDVFTDKYTAVQLDRFLDYGIIGWNYAPIFHKIHNEIVGRKVDELRAQKAKQQKQ